VKNVVGLTLIILNLGVFSEFIYCRVWSRFELHVGVGGYSAVDSFFCGNWLSFFLLHVEELFLLVYI